jgi:chemotaxis response regulator CheB
MSRKKVLLVDDSAMVRNAVRPLFDSHPKFVVCGEAEHGRDAIEKAPSLRPDLIVLDMVMPVMHGPGGRTTVNQDFASRVAHTVDVPRLPRAVPDSTFGRDTRRGSEKQGRNPLDRAG